MRGGPLVVVGDTLLDVDLHGTASRVAPDAPVPVVDCQRERHRAGGAGLAAVLAAGLRDTDVVLITALGQDRLGTRLRDLLSSHMQVIPLPLEGGTPCKIRVQASGQPVVRLDAGDGRPCPGPVSPQAERALRQAGAVLVADYGRGMAAHPGLTAMLSRLTAATPVVWDPHPAGARPLPGSRLVTPSQLEARRFASDLNGDRNGTVGPGSALASAARDAAALSQAWGSAVAITLGEGGALLSTGEAVPFLAQRSSSGRAGPAPRPAPPFPGMPFRFVRVRLPVPAATPTPGGWWRRSGRTAAGSWRPAAVSTSCTRDTSGCCGRPAGWATAWWCA